MLSFEKVILHNFGSYGHAEIALHDKGFCLVSGKNNYKKDNALSNGSGKSFIWNAVCFAITGETINGLHTNLKNINIENDDTCYVKLIFNFNADSYEITRSVSPKSDLQIIKNGTNISGKTFRETEKKLGETLPDVTKDLIASTIIIGQGMPNKFSSFSPSGRKELLEKLTKSDFMIEDIRQRVNDRLTELNGKLRECEDSLLLNNNKLSTDKKSLEKLQEEQKTKIRPDFDKQIKETEDLINTYQTKIDGANAEVKKHENNLEIISKKVVSLTEEKAAVSQEEQAAYTEAYQRYFKTQTTLNADLRVKEQEISRLKSIKDTCPTCGQKIPGAVKPNTAAQEAEAEELRGKVKAINEQLTKCNNSHTEYKNKINEDYDGDIAKLKAEESTIKGNLVTAKANVATFTSEQSLLKETLTRLKYDKENWDKYSKTVNDTIQALNASIAQLSTLVRITDDNRIDLLAHQAVVKKMETLIKRDFRGFLLENIINYINKKAKDYCEIVFETRDLNVYLDGNALDISYCGKMFDNLSGGEKQRVDLILQFAIRDMLNTYLNASSNILVLDEITDFLDKQSCASVMKLIEKELNTIESVFVVSHHATELELPIDSELKIVKNADGISEIL